MLYYIPFQYKVLNEPVTRDAEARLILDLPQQNLAEAQKNLLVRDLVRHPQISHCYLQNSSYQQHPEGILKNYSGSLPVQMKPVKVTYQKNPLGDNWQKFIFQVDLDCNGETFIPFSELEFTCRREFEVYQEAFVDDLLVCGIPLTVPQFEEGNLVKVCYGAVYELAIIDKDSNGNLIARLAKNPGNTIPINNLTNSCIHGFNLTPEIMGVLRASWQTANYNGVGWWYELCLIDGHMQNVVILHIIKENYRYFLVIDDNTKLEGYRRVEFIGFDGLQRLIKKEYGYTYTPSHQVLIDLESCFKMRHGEVMLLMELSELIASLGRGTDKEIIFDSIMQKYNLNKCEAEYYYSLCLSRF